MLFTAAVKLLMAVMIWAVLALAEMTLNWDKVVPVFNTPVMISMFALMGDSNATNSGDWFRTDGIAGFRFAVMQ